MFTVAMSELFDDVCISSSLNSSLFSVYNIYYYYINRKGV